MPEIVVDTDTSGPSEREALVAMVGRVGGRVLSYFRDQYASGNPDFTLCGPLTCTYLQEGGPRLLANLATHGFDDLRAVRARLDECQATLLRTSRELEEVRQAIASFEENYWKVNYGATHHARRSRERRELVARQETLEAAVRRLNQQAVTLLWRGQVSSAIPAPTARLAGLLRRFVTAPGRWALSLERPGQTGHFLGIVRHDDGSIEVFDPDWAIMLFPNVEALIAFLDLRLAEVPSFLEGRSVLMPFGEG